MTPTSTRTHLPIPQDGALLLAAALIAALGAPLQSAAAEPDREGSSTEPSSTESSPAPSVFIELRECEPAARAAEPGLWIDVGEVGRLAALELRAHLVEKPSSETTRAVVSCRAESVQLEVFDPVTGKTSSRHVAVSHLDPSLRARSLALALAELVLASWTEVRTNPDPTLHPLEKTASPETRRATERSLRDREQAEQEPASGGAARDSPGPGAELGFRNARWHVGGAATALVAWQSPVWLGGAQLEGRFEQGPWLAVASVGYGRGVVNRAGGSVVAEAATLAFGAGVRGPIGAGQWSAWLGLGGGPAWLSGQAEAGGVTPGQVVGAWWRPLAALELGWKRESPVRWGLRCSAGPSLQGVRGLVDGGDDVYLGDLWLGLDLFFLVSP